jgi:GNAT superfamily N-acetyltransferase
MWAMVTVPAVRDLVDADSEAWDRLYAAYASFYGVAQTSADRETVWGWLADPGHELSAIVADRGDGLVGLAHFRPFARPLSATTGCFLDDLFVDPAARSQGVATALLQELGRRAVARGWSVVRWITAEDNHPAQRVYDRVASRTAWVTYDMAPLAD